MKKINNRIVCKKLAEKIDQDNVGIECNQAQVEVDYRGVTYIVEYELTKTTNETFAETYDMPAEYDTRTVVTVMYFDTFDYDGKHVDTTFDPILIEQYFDKPFNTQFNEKQE